MYRFLMVDDEDIISQGFQARIDWAGLGFEFLPPCQDGRQAVERIQQLRPQVVMTDICMPFLDGIRLSAWIAEHHPDILVLVLSGYDDFEYARASIRNKVYDYLLKPITPADLRGLLARVRSHLDGTRGQGEQRRDERLRRWLRGEVGDGETQARPIFGEAAETRAYLVSRWDIDRATGLGDHTQATEVLRSAVKSVLSPLDSDQPHLPVFLIDPFTALAPQAGLEVIHHDLSIDRVTKLAEYLTAQLAAALNRAGFQATVGLGAAHVGLDHLADSHREAALVIDYRILRGPGVYRFLPSRELTAVAALDLDRWADQLRAVVLTGRVEEWDRLCTDLRQQLAAAKAGIRRIRQDLQQVFSILTDLAVQNLEPEEVDDREVLEAYHHITDQLRGMDDLEAQFRALLAIAHDTQRRPGASRAERTVVEFRQLVSERFFDQDLSITRVSSDLNVSPSYLSKILKRQLDRSFVEYLTEYRLERAKEFLAGSDRMTYEIAEASGYPDARYFSSIFKKLTGMTPSEFRASRRVRV